MKQLLLIAAAAAMFCSGALASTPRLVHKGDILDVEEGVTLTKFSVRNVLKQYGYRNFGPGGRSGHIITITAWGHNNVRYQIKVHYKSHEVTNVGKPRNFWY